MDTFQTGLRSLLCKDTGFGCSVNHLGALSHGRCQLGVFEVLGLHGLFDLELLHSTLGLKVEQGFQLRLVEELVELVDEDDAFFARGKL